MSRVGRDHLTLFVKPIGKKIDTLKKYLNLSGLPIDSGAILVIQEIATVVVIEVSVIL